MVFKFKLILILISFISIISCADREKKISEIVEVDIEMQMSNAYKEGYLEFQKGDALSAAKKFNEAELLFPQSPWAAKSALMAAYVYYNQGYYSDSIYELERYLTTYPNHKDKPYAHFLLGMSFYETIVDEKKDLRSILDSKRQFEIIIKEYPKTEFAKDYFRQQYGTTIAIVKLREFKGSLEFHLKRELQEEKKNESKKDDKKDGNKKDGNKKDGKKDGKTTTKSSSKKNFLTRRMRWFYIFSGWSHEEEDDPNCRTPYRPEAIDAWLQLLCEILPMDTIEERMDDNPCLVSVEKVCRALGTDGEGLFPSNWRTTNTFKTLLSNLRKDDFNISPKKKRSGSSGNGNGSGSGSGKW